MIRAPSTRACAAACRCPRCTHAHPVDHHRDLVAATAAGIAIGTALALVVIAVIA